MTDQEKQNDLILGVFILGFAFGFMTLAGIIGLVSLFT